MILFREWMGRGRRRGRAGRTPLFAVLLCAAAVAAAALEPQGEALRRLAASSEEPVVLRRKPGSPAPYFASFRIPAGRFSVARTAEGKAEDFWKTYGAAFGVAAAREELDARIPVTDGLGMTHIRYDQRYRGLAVFGRQLVLHMDAEAVTAVNGEFTPGIGVETAPGLSAWEAADIALENLAGKRPRSSASAPVLLIYVDREERPHLAWRVTVPTEKPLGFWRVFVEAKEGTVLFSYDDLQTAKNRTTYTNGNDPDCNTSGAPACVLPGTLVRSEAGPASADPVIETTHGHAGTVYDYFQGRFGRDSYDGAGHAIRSTSHFGSGYNNAFWCSDACALDLGSAPDGEQMAYGDGDGVFFSSLALALDIAAHELTHAVTEKTAGLIYDGQSGALNESYSDVFAVMVDTGDWLLGEDVFTPAIAGDALRSLEDPPLFGQPGHMNDYFHTIFDNRGVHINSGIPNKAAYLIAADPVFGIGRPDTERIYYRALTLYLTPSAGFRTNFSVLAQSAADLFGATSAQADAVRRAHIAVGLGDPPGVTFPNGGESLQGGVATTVTWNPGAGGQFAVEFLRDSGALTYSQGFEATALPPEFSTEVGAPWFPDTSEVDSGTRSARSGVIGDGGRSVLSLSRRMTAAGNVTFRLRVSSEENFDFLSFYIDDVLHGIGHGEAPWQTASFFVPAGTHTFTWVYEKDGSVSAGLDAAFIDSIVVPNAENVVTTTIAASTPPGASSQSWTPPSTPGTNFRVRVRRLGAPARLSSDDSDATFAVVGASSADLSLSLADSPDPVATGGNVTYTAAVANAGPAPASNVAVTASLPAGAAFVSASGAGWSCASSPPSVTCTRPSLPVGAAPAIAIVVLAPSGATMTATASISAAEPDPLPSNNAASATTTLTASAWSFYTLNPCRVADTRAADGPALNGASERLFQLAGLCGVPATAKALSLNITVTQPTELGHLSLYPAGSALPLVSAINYRPGQTRANNAILFLGAGGAATVFCGQASGTVHFIVDVNGYFE